MCHILDVAVVTQFCSLSMPYFIVHHIIYCTEINFLCLLKENLKLLLYCCLDRMNGCIFVTLPWHIFWRKKVKSKGSEHRLIVLKIICNENLAMQIA